MSTYSRRVELARQKLDALGIDPGGRNPYTVFRQLDPDTRSFAARAVHTGPRGDQYVRLSGLVSNRQRFQLPSGGQLIRTVGAKAGRLGTLQAAIDKLPPSKEVRVTATLLNGKRSRRVTLRRNAEDLSDGRLVQAILDAAGQLYKGGLWTAADITEVQLFVPG